MPAQHENEFTPREQLKVRLLAGICTYSMVVGVSSIMPLLPLLSRTFDVPLTSASLLIMAFTLPGVLFTPLAGVLADKYGRRFVLIPSLLLFAAAGSACALAPNFETLVLLRFLQGIGAASFGVLNTTVLGDTFKGPELARFIGYNMTLLSICTALYPSIGGFLAQIDWRLPFVLPLFSLPGIVLALKTPLQGKGSPTPLSGYVRAMLTSASTPVIRRLLLITFFTFILLYGPIITSFPILADIKFNAPPALIGSMMMLFSLGTGLMSSQLGRLSQRFSRNSILVASQCFYLAALITLPLMPSLLWLLPCMLIYGMGQGLNIPNIQSTLISTALPEQRASIMALNGTILRCGQTISPLLFTVIIDWQGVNSPFWLALLFPVGIICIASRLPQRKPT